MLPKKTTTPMTDAAIKALIAQGVATALAEYESNRGNGNGDDSHDSESGRRTERATRECTYSDFLKCQPLNFKGTEGVVGLTQRFKKMESVFHISNCTVTYQIKFATCTLLGNALTWWNSHIKTVGHDAAYGMPWKTLMMMLTDKYCPRGEIKKLEIKMWNLKVKGTDVGSVMASKPKTMQEAIEIANDLMDQKVRAYAERQIEKKMKFDNNNQAQQQPPKKQSVAIAYTAGNCKKVGHMTRDCRNPAAAKNQRTLTYFECGNQGHYMSDCPELKNQNHRNQTRGTEAREMVYALEGGETDQDLDDMEDDINAWTLFPLGILVEVDINKKTENQAKMTKLSMEWKRLKDGYEYMGRNFVGLARDMHIFVGNMSYVMDFTIRENIETNIDPSLSNIEFGRPFIEIACLAINRKYGLMTFTDGIKEITFKTPYKDPERSELSSEGHELLSSRVILSEDDYDRGCKRSSDLEDGFYRDTIKLGPEYLTGIDDEGEVTLYLTRRSLEVLRKFHWMILGGRFNQLSHVSSLLLSKPGEY
ncbi:reverse transcriptase domain-containing protein [Tanacetum coccineum]